ncbi:plancitoxin-1 isoform X2 [Anoplophora glabripennis]|nr:plancitoxin-1 isoform X2 [Anoplophora glabripennis]
MRVVLILYFLETLIVWTNTQQCMDENNKPVDWYVVYKLPEIKHHHKLLKSGVAYTFMTSDNYDSWTFSNKSINSTTSILANTINDLYSAQGISYVLYNDQPPPDKKSKSNKGHNKGVVMVNYTGGFWLVHSVPHFPMLGKTYIFPRTGAVFGQSFLCLSLSLENLNKVGTQLQYNQPEIYSQNINSNLKASLPDLVKAAMNVTINTAPWYSVMEILTQKGVQFTSFAKSKAFNKDLYEDLVAPSLETDLYVETWPNGGGRLQSNCTKKYKVTNVKSVYLSAANVTFNTTHDHSKWAVTPPSQAKNWFCIGDINRAEHQKVRGGGTVCLNNKQLSTDYKKSVESIEECNKTMKGLF